MTLSVVHKSCNRTLIGKTYWKSVILPSVLFSSSVIVWREGELDELQRSENSVWRFVMQAPGYTPITALRGEVGASNMKVRDIKGKLKYAKYALENAWGLVTAVFEDAYNKGYSMFIKTVKGYITRIGLESLEQLRGMTGRELERTIRNYDRQQWQCEMQQKSTLELYRTFKQDITQEIQYDNTFKAALLFRARTNTLNLGWRNQFQGGDGLCKLCSCGEVETLEHFMTECNSLRQERLRFDYEGIDMPQLLHFVDVLEVGKCQEYLLSIWLERKKILKNKT